MNIIGKFSSTHNYVLAAQYWTLCCPDIYFHQIRTHLSLISVSAGSPKTSLTSNIGLRHSCEKRIDLPPHGTVTLCVLIEFFVVNPILSDLAVLYRLG